MASVNALSSNSILSNTSERGATLACEVSRTTEYFLATKKVFARVALHCLKRYEKNRPIDEDEVRRQLHHGFAKNVENIQPDAHPVWAFVDEAATLDAFEMETMGLEERKREYGEFHDVKTWDGLATVYMGLQRNTESPEFTLPRWFRFKVFHGQHRIHITAHAIATKHRIAPNVDDRRLWVDPKWYWYTIIVNHATVKDHQLKIWCTVSHQTSTFKENDPISIIQALYRYQIAFSEITPWMVNILGVNVNDRCRSWLRGADKAFGKELAEMAGCPYFSWFFPHWDGLTLALCPSNVTVARKLVMELLAEARRRASAYNINVDELTDSVCFQNLKSADMADPHFPRVWPFIRLPNDVGQSYGERKEFFEENLVAFRHGEVSEFTGEAGCGLGRGRIWTRGMVWGNAPMGFKSRTTRLKELLQVLWYIQDKKEPPSVRKDFYPELASILGWTQPDGVDTLHEEFRVLWKCAGKTESSVKKCISSKLPWEKRIAQAIQDPNSLLCALYSLSSAKKFFETSRVGPDIVKLLVPAPGSPPKKGSKSIPPVPISIVHRPVDSAPGPSHRETSVGRVLRKRRRVDEGDDGLVDLNPPERKKRKLPSRILNDILEKILATELTLDEFARLTVNYDQDDIHLKAARLALEGQMKAHQESAVVVAAPQKQNRRSMRHDHSSIIQHIHENRSVVELLLKDKKILSWLREGLGKLH